MSTESRLLRPLDLNKKAEPDHGPDPCRLDPMADNQPVQVPTDLTTASAAFFTGVFLLCFAWLLLCNKFRRSLPYSAYRNHEDQSSRNNSFREHVSQCVAVRLATIAETKTLMPTHGNKIDRSV